MVNREIRKKEYKIKVIHSLIYLYDGFASLTEAGNTLGSLLDGCSECCSFQIYLDTNDILIPYILHTHSGKLNIASYS